MASSKKAAEEFVKRWTGKGNEEQDKHLYWIGLFQDVLGLTDALDRLKFEQPVHTKASAHQGFIDVLIPTASVIVEQKGIELIRQILPELMELGVPRGPEIGRLLEALRGEVIDGKLENSREALLKRARELI